MGLLRYITDIKKAKERKNMKKMIALFLTLCMLLGCAVSAGAESLPKYRIGFFYGDFTSKLGEQFLNCLKYIADDLNV